MKWLGAELLAPAGRDVSSDALTAASTSQAGMIKRAATDTLLGDMREDLTTKRKVRAVLAIVKVRMLNPATEEKQH